MHLKSALLALCLTCVSYGHGYSTELCINVEASSPKNKAILEHAIRDVYPDLPPHQQELIRQGLYFVAYEGPLLELSEGTSGFGPEDDPAYRYPDTTLYPTGTIKVNITLGSIGEMEAAKPGSEERKSIVDLIAHEIKHVEQYMAHPVHALSDPSECPAGICSEELLEETKIKLGYELEATLFGVKIAGITFTKDELKGVNLGYGAMYWPAVLVKACVTDSLTATERAEAEHFLKLDNDSKGEFENLYPYLPPVFKRLKECMGH